MYNLTVEEAHTFFVSSEQVLVHNSCPFISPKWGRNRTVKELHRRGFILQGPSKTGGGLIYAHPETGQALRIMPRPRVWRRSDPPAKYLNDYYYRYRTSWSAPYGPHTTIPNK
jgi:hypothetical protein